MAKTYAGRGGSQGDWRMAKPKKKAPAKARSTKTNPTQKKTKKLAPTYTGPSPFTEGGRTASGVKPKAQQQGWSDWQGGLNYVDSQYGSLDAALDKIKKIKDWFF